MKKEKVIIFEGEHNFVAPKSRVRDKKTGISYKVEDYLNVVASSDVAPIDKPIEDVPPALDVSQGSGDPRPMPTGGGGTTTSTTSDTTTERPPIMDDKKTTLPEPDVQLGSPRKTVIEEAPVTTNVRVDLPIAVPTNLGKAPAPIMGGGGGGGGSKEAAAPKKSLLQQYWWILLVLGVGGYMYYKRKK